MSTPKWRLYPNGYGKENSPAGEVTKAIIESLATMEAVSWHSRFAESDNAVADS